MSLACLLARATVREKEMALRQSLGATSARLARQLLTEGLVLSFVGGALGVALAFLSLPLLRLGAGTAVPRLDEVHINGNVLLFSIALCILTGIALRTRPGLASFAS